MDTHTAMMTMAMLMEPHDKVIHPHPAYPIVKLRSGVDLPERATAFLNYKMFTTDVGREVSKIMNKNLSFSSHHNKKMRTKKGDFHYKEKPGAVASTISKLRILPLIVSQWDDHHANMAPKLFSQRYITIVSKPYDPPPVDIGRLYSPEQVIKMLEEINEGSI